MATMDELSLKSGDLRNVRLADYLGKRSGAFPFGWSMRYVVLSGNFLFVYSSPKASLARNALLRAARPVGPPSPRRNGICFYACIAPCGRRTRSAAACPRAFSTLTSSTPPYPPPPTTPPTQPPPPPPPHPPPA